VEKNTGNDYFEKLQAEIIENARKLYSEKVVDRWLHPRNLGAIENPQGFGKITGPCGDTMEISLRIMNDKIIEAKFLTDGCATSLAAGSMATELASGKNIQEGFKISQELILDKLDGLPEESEHCALLASNALKSALRDHFASKREPWKKAYKNTE